MNLFYYFVLRKELQSIVSDVLTLHEWKGFSIILCPTMNFWATFVYVLNLCVLHIGLVHVCCIQYAKQGKWLIPIKLLSHVSDPFYVTCII